MDPAPAALSTKEYRTRSQAQPCPLPALELGGGHEGYILGPATSQKMCVAAVSPTGGTSLLSTLGTHVTVLAKPRAKFYAHDGQTEAASWCRCGETPFARWREPPGAKPLPCFAHVSGAARTHAQNASASMVREPDRASPRPHGDSMVPTCEDRPTI